MVIDPLELEAAIAAVYAAQLPIPVWWPAEARSAFIEEYASEAAGMVLSEMDAIGDRMSDWAARSHVSDADESAMIASAQQVLLDEACSEVQYDLTEMIATELHASGADPALLTFELTETAATPAIDSLRDFTSRIQQLGCGLSLDDVGTGFGSLTYLRHLPFTELKIDMQFVRGMLDANADARIVESLVLIARGLGIRTVAEGVESAALIEPLHELGVDYGQGYLFGRPAPIEVPD